MLEGEKFSVIPDDLKVLAEAYSKYIEVTNRAWLACVTIGFSSVFIDAQDDLVKYENFAIESHFFIWLATAVCSALLIYYCSCQMMTYQFSQEFGQYLHDIGAGQIKVSENTNLKDFAYKMILPNYVRIFPITLGMPRKAATVFMTVFKPTLDVAFSATPFFIVLILANKSFFSARSEDQVTALEILLFASVSIIFLVSAISSITLIIRQLNFQKVLRRFSYKSSGSP